MTAYLSSPYHTGRKTWYHLTADTERELERYAERLNVELHGGNYSPHGLIPHLDLNEHKAELALRYGARMMEDEDE